MSNVVPLKPRAVPAAALTVLDTISAVAARLDDCGPAAAAWRRFIDAAVFAARGDLTGVTINQTLTGGRLN